MSGKARDSVGLVVGCVFVLLHAGGCGVDDEQGSGCERYCEKLASLECADATEDECLSDCRDVEAEYSDTCPDPLSDFLSCAGDAEWRCEPGTCIPSETNPEPCPAEPEIVGCQAEGLAFENCADGGDCDDEEGGGGTGLTEDGRTIDYDYSSACGYCPMPLLGGAPEGDPCASPGDCAGVCCACPNRDIAATVCLDGLCADACDPSLGLCDS